MKNDITKIDKNFASKDVRVDGNTYELPCAPFEIHGGYYQEGEGFIKMPPEISEKISQGVNWGSRCGSGIRVSFSTDSKNMEIDVDCFAVTFFRHMTYVMTNGFTITERKNGKEKFVQNVIPPTDWVAPNEFSVVVLEKWKKSVPLIGDGKKHNYMLYLPVYTGIKRMSLTFDDGAVVGAGEGYRTDVKPMMYYGSSITQGGCASRASNLYQCHVADYFNVDYVNHGFSGCAKGEEGMADFLAEQECSVFICDYDHNSPDAEHLRATHERLFQKFRAKQPNTPVVFMTRPNGKNFVRVDSDRNARWKAVHDTYENARKKGDKNVYFVDGKKFFPKGLTDMCLFDGIHPNDLGFYYMAKALIRTLKQIIR